MKVLNKFYFSLLLSFPAVSNNIPSSDLFINYNEKVANLAAKELMCSGKSRVLNKNIFNGITLTSEEVNVILEYKDTNAFILCSNYERLEYYKASVLLRLTSPEHADSLNSSDELISYHDIWLLKSKREYEKINSDIRKKIDAIKALDKPFNIIASHEVLTKK